MRTRAGKSYLLLLVLSLASLPGLAVTRYVSQDGGQNNSACTDPAYPCATITYAMAVASGGAPGDTIIVGPGQYMIYWGEVFPIVVKSGVRLTAADMGHGATIDATGANARVFNVPSSNDATEISGFAIRGGRAPSGGSSEGGAIWAAGSLRILRNIFYDNVARGADTANAGSNGGFAYGGAISIISGSPTIANNVFASNFAYGGRGGDNPSGPGGPGGFASSGALNNGGAGTIQNNTFHGNYAIGGDGGSGTTTGNGGNASSGAAHTGSATIVANNIYASNGAQGGSGATQGQGSYGAAFVGLLGALNTNNLYYFNFPSPEATDPGASALFQDPLFHANGSNLRLAPYSPARGAGYAPGAPATDVEGTPRPTPPSVGAYEASGELLVTDLNADGRSDILWRNSLTGQVYRLLMNGFAVTSGAVVYNEPNLSWRIVADADFNGDGVGDLVYRNLSTGAVFIVYLGPNGTAAGGGLVAVEPNTAWKIVAAPDVDGDEQADLLWWNASTGQVWVMLLDGTTVKDQGMAYVEPNTSWRIVASGNFAGSHKNQVLWRNTATGQVFLMYVGYQAGTFYGEARFLYQEPNTAWRIAATGDFDGNSIDDILWRNEATGQVYMMLLAGGVPGAQAMVHTEPNLAWKIVAAGDYDGDGRADILWRNDSTGHVYLMRMNGLAITQQGFVYTEPIAAWRILGPMEYAQTQ